MTRWLRFVVLGALAFVPRTALAEPPPTFVTNYYVPGFNQVSQMTLAPGGEVYVADTYNHRVTILRQDGFFLGTVPPPPDGFGLPSGVVFDHAGNLLVADQSKQRISRFSSALVFLGNFSAFGSGGGSLQSPTNLALSPDGTRLYVTELLNDRVMIFSPTGTFLGGFGAHGTAPGLMDHPFGIAVNAAGDVFVADQLNNRIQRFDATGNYLAQWGTPGPGPGQFDHVVGVGFDAAGDLYATDQLNNRVQKLRADGTFLTRWGAFGDANGQFFNPWCVLALPDLKVWVGDTYNHRLGVFQTLATPAPRASWGSVKARYR
jgi:DNA-binding beta-propeller fold protein YncE